jgi:hypothetical protein
MRLSRSAGHVRFSLRSGLDTSHAANGKRLYPQANVDEENMGRQNPFDGLAEFLAVANNKNVRKAALELKIIPGAVSQALQKLERRNECDGRAPHSLRA